MKSNHDSPKAHSKRWIGRAHLEDLRPILGSAAAGLYGFSWTVERTLARDKFAEPQRVTEGGAVLMQTIAPPEAVLQVREPVDFYDEGAKSSFFARQ